MRPSRRKTDPTPSFGSELHLVDSSSGLTLRVPARPEALGIVRLVLMSCGANSGLELKDIFALSREVAEAFTDMLVARPEARTIVIRADTGLRDVDVEAVAVAQTNHEF